MCSFKRELDVGHKLVVEKMQFHLGVELFIKICYLILTTLMVQLPHWYLAELLILCLMWSLNTATFGDAIDFSSNTSCGRFLYEQHYWELLNDLYEQLAILSKGSKCSFVLTKRFRDFSIFHQLFQYLHANLPLGYITLDI